MHHRLCVRVICQSCDVPIHDRISEQRSEEQPDRQIGAECKFRLTAAVLIDKSTDSSDQDTEERGEKHGFPADQQTACAHDERIAQLDAAPDLIRTGSLADDCTADLADDEERNTDTNQSDQMLPDGDIFVLQELRKVISGFR